MPVDVQGVLIDPALLIGFNGNLIELASDEDVTENTKLELNCAQSPISEAVIEEVIDRLQQVKRPVIFVGSGVRISGMQAEFLELINKLKIPVVTGWNAHDVLANDSPYFAGRPGTVGDPAGNFTLQNADFLLILGSRLNIRQVSYNWKGFALNAWKAMVDVDRAELEKPTLEIDLKVNANLRDFIPSLFLALDNYQAKKGLVKRHFILG